MEDVDAGLNLEKVRIPVEWRERKANRGSESEGVQSKGWK